MIQTKSIVKARPWKILRYRSDRRSLVFLTLGLTLLFSALTLRWNELTVLGWLINVLGGILMVFWISLLNHNHHHHPTFHSRRLNTVMDFLITLCIGAPSTRLHVVHHFNHHRHFRGDKDWTNYEVHAKSRGLFRVFYYLFSASRKMNQNRNQILPAGLLKSKQNWERSALWLFIGFAIWINAALFLAVIVPSWLGGLSLLLASNLMNHDACDLQSEHGHSRNFLSRFENWFSMNNGFHAAHHAKPALHWSQLPAYHEEHLSRNLPPELEQNSFFVYGFKYVFFNRV